MNTSAPIPKAELHLHIEGTLEPELVFRLARRNGIRLPYANVAELRAQYQFTDLQSFLDLYYAMTTVLRTAEDFADLANAYFERARAQGVRHAEISFDPQAHTARGVPLEAVLEGLWEAVRHSRTRYGISSHLILSFLRDLGPEAAMATLEQALPWRDRIVAVGLDSAERDHPPRLFTEVYARARAEGLRCVAHAGEEGPPSYLEEALDLLQVERIDHGVACMDDPKLVARLARDRVPLTVCPLSNVRLRVVERLSEHRLPDMLDAGLLVTVNSDDPAYFGGYVADNLDAVATAFHLNAAEVRRLAENSFHAAFLTEPERRAYLAEVAAATACPELL